MTLIELLVSITIFGVVVSTSVAFMARQNAAFQDSIRRLVALRNLRYAVATLAQDLESLGTNVPDPQPALYYADEDVIVFSADYATNVADDPFAVFHDPDAPAGQVRAPTGGFSIPNSGAVFPDTLYESAPGVSGEETVFGDTCRTLPKDLAEPSYFGYRIGQNAGLLDVPAVSLLLPRPLAKAAIRIENP